MDIPIGLFGFLIGVILASIVWLVFLKTRLVVNDYAIAIAEDAFRAGWDARELKATGPSAAGYCDDSYNADMAWSLYEPSEEVKDLTR